MSGISFTTTSISEKSEEPWKDDLFIQGKKSLVLQELKRLSTVSQKGYSVGPDLVGHQAHQIALNTLSIKNELIKDQEAVIGRLKESTPTSSLTEKLSRFAADTAAFATLRQTPYPTTAVSAYFGLKKNQEGVLGVVSATGAAVVVLKILPKLMPGVSLFPAITLANVAHLGAEEAKAFLPKDLDKTLCIDSEFGPITGRQVKILLDMVQIPTDILRGSLQEIEEWLKKALVALQENNN